MSGDMTQSVYTKEFFDWGERSVLEELRRAGASRDLDRAWEQYSLAFRAYADLELIVHTAHELGRTTGEQHADNLNSLKRIKKTIEAREQELKEREGTWRLSMNLLGYGSMN